MGYDYWEAEQDAAYEAMQESILKEFQEDRFTEFFYEHKTFHQRAYWMLDEATRYFANQEHGPALVYGCSSIEITLRDLLLRPLISGSIMDGYVAALVSQKILESQLPRIKDLLFEFILMEVKIDLRTYKRPDQNKTLWQEIEEARESRNRLVHLGEPVEPDIAEKAVHVAETLIQKVFSQLLEKAGFRITKDNTITRRPPKTEATE